MFSSLKRAATGIVLGGAAIQMGCDKPSQDAPAPPAPPAKAATTTSAEPVLLVPLDQAFKEERQAALEMQRSEGIQRVSEGRVDAWKGYERGASDKFDVPALATGGLLWGQGIPSSKADIAVLAAHQHIFFLPTLGDPKEIRESLSLAVKYLDLAADQSSGDRKDRVVAARNVVKKFAAQWEEQRALDK